MVAGGVAWAAAVAGLVAGWLTADAGLMWAALGCLAAGAGCFVLYWLAALGVHCPLCRARLLIAHGCARSPKAARLLGSHRLAVALAALTGRSFRCPYCGEPCIGRVRDPHQPPPRSRRLDRGRPRPPAAAPATGGGRGNAAARRSV